MAHDVLRGSPTDKGFARLQEGSSTEVGAASEQELKEVYAKLQATFKTGRTKTLEWRVKQLQGIRTLCLENCDEIIEAVKMDLGRPRQEALFGDIGGVLGEVDYALAHVKSWMKPETVATPALQKPGHSKVKREPKGLVLNLAPWNFPVNVALIATVPIVAAGNCCVIKPSEVSSNCEKLLRRLIPKYLDSEAIAVVTGGVAESTALLKLRWDHIIYTGNGAVARVVSRAAAEHLTPVTLELGGKSPTVILPGANVKVAAKRILTSKCFNAGQICIAPDYLLIHESMEAPLIQEMKKVLKDWFNEDASKSRDFGRIINKRHFLRVKSLIETAGGEIVCMSGQMDEESKFIPPTLIKEPRADSPIMEEEIFGPVLPMLKKKSVQDIIDHINASEKPLALYVFGPESQCNKVIDATSSGGVCVNDTVFQVNNPNLPFGGVGASGCGKYHGKWGFEEFSHARAIMYRGTWLDMSARYPPYTESNYNMFHKLLIRGFCCAKRRASNAMDKLSDKPSDDTRVATAV